jgi:hypothetical protein
MKTALIVFTVFVVLCFVVVFMIASNPDNPDICALYVPCFVLLAADLVMWAIVVLA